MTRAKSQNFDAKNRSHVVVAERSAIVDRHETSSEPKGRQKKKALRFPAGPREELLLAQFLATSGATGCSNPQILKPMRVQRLILPGPTGESCPTKLSVIQNWRSTGPKS